jgi:K+-transporting ATPase ATPase C chain
MFLAQLRIAALALASLTAVTGVAYPLAITGIAKAAFPAKASGSLVQGSDGKVVGSALLGQPFDDPKYFWGRLSATTPSPYNGGGSTGSNLGPTNPALVTAVKGRVTALREADPGNAAPIPIDLVTASGSGLDPDISPAGALYQVGRIARVRGVDAARVRAIVLERIASPALGIFGDPHVNVLALNTALDALGR